MRPHANDHLSSNLSVVGPSGDHRARLSFLGQTIDASVGKRGIIAPGEIPAEGDQKTPTGSFKLCAVYFRPDRIRLPGLALPTRIITPDMLWCDDPDSALYNRPVRAPFPYRHEKMWREDRAYDVCIVLDFNLMRPIPGRGSAIFFHLTKQDGVLDPTAGCVAVQRDAMLSIVNNFSPTSRLDIAHREAS